MYLEELVFRLLEDVRREKTMLRYVAQLALPLHLIPLMALIIQLFRFGWEIIACLLGIVTLLCLVELTTQPVMKRIRRLVRDCAVYLPSLVPLGPLRPPTLADWRWVLPGATTAVLSVALLVPLQLGRTTIWQQASGATLALAVGLWSATRPLYSRRFLDRVEARADLALALLQSQRRTPEPPRGARKDGLLDKTLLGRTDMLARTGARLSPAALALLRVETYNLLRDNPDATTALVRSAISDWSEAAQEDERRHWPLPPVGGKIYLPVAAGTTLAHALGSTAQRLGLDGAYSATLGTWLIRLPPARSYAVQARLIDALAALGILPLGAPLIHHLTVAGNMGRMSVLPTLLHLLSTPLIFEERPGSTQKDDRPFIMRGGGVIDNLDRNGRRGTGARTDFVDGFLLFAMPDMQEVEQITAHAVNLRIKQLLAWPILILAKPEDEFSRIEREALTRFWQFRRDLDEFMTRYNLQGALTIDWIDGSWREQWNYVQAISKLKQDDPDFLDHAQALRDGVLDDLEDLAFVASEQERGQ